MSVILLLLVSFLRFHHARRYRNFHRLKARYSLFSSHIYFILLMIKCNQNEPPQSNMKASSPKFSVLLKEVNFNFCFNFCFIFLFFFFFYFIFLFFFYLTTFFYFILFLLFLFFSLFCGGHHFFLTLPLPRG